MCNHNLLIDFNSPLQGRLEKSLKPLVPSPELRNTRSHVNNIIPEVDSEVDNNPFDFVDRQTNVNIRNLNDPFELAYYYPENNNDANTDPTEENKEDVEPEDDKNASCCVLDISTSTNVNPNEAIGDGLTNSFIENITDPCVDICVSFSDISPIKKLPSRTENTFDRHLEDNNANINVKLENNASEMLDTSEEALKAIVANRVNVCIQNALNRSKLCYNNLELNQDVDVPIRQNTSFRHTSFSQNDCTRKINISATDYTNNTQTFRQIHRVSSQPILKSNWCTPQKNASSFEESCGELNNAVYSPVYSGLRGRLSASSCEIMRVTSPSFKSKTDLLECVGNSDMRNRSCIGALWSSDKKTRNLLTKFEEKSELLPVRNSGNVNNELTAEERFRNIRSNYSKFLDKE
ncbi:hypothetical protein L9F63_009318, partial [Diploptera punctata]